MVSPIETFVPSVVGRDVEFSVKETVGDAMRTDAAAEDEFVRMLPVLNDEEFAEEYERLAVLGIRVLATTTEVRVAL